MCEIQPTGSRDQYWTFCRVVCVSVCVCARARVCVCTYVHSYNRNYIDQHTRYLGLSRNSCTVVCVVVVVVVVAVVLVVCVCVCVCVCACRALTSEIRTGLEQYKVNRALL